MFFFFNDTATTEIYTLSLHDALPISGLQHLRPHADPAARPRGPRRRRAMDASLERRRSGAGGRRPHRLAPGPAGRDGRRPLAFVGAPAGRRDAVGQRSERPRLLADALAREVKALILAGHGVPERAHRRRSSWK